VTPNLMHSSLFVALVAVAAIHALLPTHWLSFVLVARAQKWSRARMLEVVLLSGLGHVLSTTLVGLAAAALGKGVHKYVDKLDTPLPALILCAFGLYYLVLGWRRDGHPHCAHDHSEDPIQADKVAVWALFLEMTLSPCETLIPIFFASGGLSWPTLLLMALVMSAITILAMGVLSFIGYTGYQKITFPWLEHNERLVLGALLIGLGGFGYFYH
jgi:nickel/cobalt transporter (NicO) family protein